jgi:sensor histidine kinase YesM
MDDKKHEISVSFRWLQILLWAIFILGLYVYSSNKYGIRFSLYSTCIAMMSYLLAVYGNSHFLMPRFFKNNSVVIYLLYAVFFIIAVVLLKTSLERIVLLPYHKVFYTMQLPHVILGFITVVIAFLFGGFLYTARNYVSLLKQQEKMKTQQLTAELNLLKQQVQPHFLFNTLNNIYSLANAKSDNTKIAIERLADIMRYFTEDAPKEKVPLQTEIDFINNYISLEQLRMVYPVRMNINFTRENIPVPTMLLMPFMENLFKHGIDKTKNDNEVLVKLSVQNKRLQYSVKNKLHPETKNGTGFGLSNLKKRLNLLYGDDYTMTVKENDTYFEAYMEIPL